MGSPQRLHWTRRSSRHRPIPRGNHTIAAITPSNINVSPHNQKRVAHGSITHRGNHIGSPGHARPPAGTPSAGDPGVTARRHAALYEDPGSNRQLPVVRLWSRHTYLMGRRSRASARGLWVGCPAGFHSSLMAAALYCYKMTGEAPEPIVSNYKIKVMYNVTSATHVQAEMRWGSHVPTVVPEMADSYAGGFSEGIGTPLCILEKRRASN
jgi:hypothetical protein